MQSSVDKPKTVQINLRRFPAGLYRKAKVEAAKRNITLKQFVVDSLNLNLKFTYGKKPCSDG